MERRYSPTRNGAGTIASVHVTVASSQLEIDLQPYELEKKMKKEAWLILIGAVVVGAAIQQIAKYLRVVRSSVVLWSLRRSDVL